MRGGMGEPLMILRGVNVYDGLPWDAERPVVPCEGIVLQDAWAEPMWHVVSAQDGSGRTIDYVPARPLKCRTCGAQTSREVLLELIPEDMGFGPDGKVRWLRPVSMAECVACGKARFVRYDAAHGQQSADPQGQAETPPEGDAAPGGTVRAGDVAATRTGM